MYSKCLFLSLLFCAIAVLPAAAQDAPDQSGVAPTTDLIDLWHIMRHHPEADDTMAGRRFLLFAPSIGSKPTTGLSAGVSGSVAFFKGGNADTTHISMFIGNLRVSQKKQTLFDNRLALFTSGDRWFFLGDNRMSWTSENTYALGIDAPKTSGTSLKFNVVKVYETAYRKIRPGLFFGAGINLSSHWNVRPGTSTTTAAWNDSAYVVYSATHGFASGHQHSGGASVGLRYDTRDNGINAERGSLASATYRTFFNGFLGGDSAWQELSLDVRTYRKLTPSGRHKLAFWFMGDMVTRGTAPYWDLPATAADGRSARGYSEGRYRGQRLLYWETEYRGALTSNGLLGMVVFANATTVARPEPGERPFQSFAPGAGFGLRVLLNKRSRTNLCTDWGWGRQGSHGFYLAIQEVF